MRTINNGLIRSFKPCYDPSEHGIPDNETLSAVEWVSKYRGIVPDWDILWLLLRQYFYSAKDLRLFAVWCAREAFKLIDNPDPRSVNAVHIAEYYANGDATDKELKDAKYAARDAARDAMTATCAAAADAAWYAAWESATDASWYAATSAGTVLAAVAAWASENAEDARGTVIKQLDYLLNTFTML